MKKYLLALLMTFIITILQWKIPFFINRNLFLLLYPAVFFSSWFGGLGPGLLSTLFGSLAGWIIFSPSYGKINLTPHEIEKLLVFFCMGVAMSILNAMIRKSYNNEHLIRIQLEEARDKLKRHAEMLQKANDAKDLFLANTSHEIRTPLGAIIGFAELLQEQDLAQADRLKYSEIILRNGQNLSRIINDILDLTKIEANHLEISKVDFLIRPFMQEIIDLLSAVALEKKIKLTVSEVGETPAMIYTDPLRLRQILTNILGNAIKFTKEGYVQLEYEFKSSQSEKYFEFIISDSGIGIPTELQNQLFQKFFQADQTSDRRFGGTGIGLNISRQLASKLGGQVQLLQSQPNEGTSFSVRIPYEKSNTSQTSVALPNIIAASCQPLSKQSSRDMKVLLVDDCLDMQFLIESILIKNNINVEVASSGHEALAKVKNQTYDLILMDVQMPNLDGYSTIRELRKRHILTPVIAVTAHAMVDDLNKSLLAGCAGHLTKPIQVPELLKSVASFAARQAPESFH